MLNERSYMKNITPGVYPKGFIHFILILTTGIYVIENLLILWFNNQWFMKLFGLSPEGIKSGFIWQIMSYSLLHDPILDGGIWHILFNGLLIFFIGKPLESEIGSKKCAILYIIAAIFGGITWLLCHWQSMNVLIGASGAAMGLLTIFCIRHAEEYMTFLVFFIFPITMKPKWILLLITAYEFISLMSTELFSITGSYRVANSAHLGGILGGCFFYLFTEKINLLNYLQFNFHKKSNAPQVKSFTINLQNRHHLKAEVDRILDKINQKGFGALTAEEKSTLDKARDLL